MEETFFRDKVEGMLLCGAYGDALGAPHELAGLQGGVTDPTGIYKLSFGKNFYHDPQPNQWNVWPPPDLVSDFCGIVTDDTAYRISIFHEFLRDALSRGEIFTEARFREWMSGPGKSLHQGERPDWFLECRNAQIDHWLEMFAAREKNEEAVFFIPDIPIVFGIFLYQELGVLFPGKPSPLIYSIFRNLCKLDQSYAGVITGLTNTLMAAAMGVERPERQSFADWFRDSAAELLAEVGQLAGESEDGEFITRLKNITSEMQKLGGDLQNASELNFVTELKHRVYDHSDWFNPRLKNFDPLLFWMQMVAATAYGGSDPICALRVLAASAGDADTVPSVLGSLIGTYYGLREMFSLRSLDLRFGDELMKVQDYLNTLLGVNLLEESELFWKAYQLQNGLA